MDKDLNSKDLEKVSGGIRNHSRPQRAAENIKVEKYCKICGFVIESWIENRRVSVSRAEAKMCPKCNSLKIGRREITL